MANPELDNYVVPPLEKENTDLRDRIAALEREYDSRLAAMDRSRAKADEQWTAKVASLAEALELSVAQHREAATERDALKAHVAALLPRAEAWADYLDRADRSDCTVQGEMALKTMVEQARAAVEAARKAVGQ